LPTFGSEGPCRHAAVTLNRSQSSFTPKHHVYLIHGYANGEREDLTPQQIRVLAQLIQNWEQHRTRPTRPARALLKIVASDPKSAIEALHARARRALFAARAGGRRWSRRARAALRAPSAPRGGSEHRQPQVSAQARGRSTTCSRPGLQRAEVCEGGHLVGRGCAHRLLD
jgi:hypothetical protein